VDAEAPELGPHQEPVIALRAVANPLCQSACQSAVPVNAWERFRPLKRGNPVCFPLPPPSSLDALEPAEERLVGLVQPREHVVQHVAVEGGIVQERGPEPGSSSTPLPARSARPRRGGAARRCCAVPRPCCSARGSGSARAPPPAPAPAPAPAPDSVSGAGSPGRVCGRGCSAVPEDRTPFLHHRAETARGGNFWLQPAYASPPGFKSSGLRRAQAQFCQPYPSPFPQSREFGTWACPEWLATEVAPRRPAAARSACADLPRSEVVSDCPGGEPAQAGFAAASGPLTRRGFNRQPDI
jgi:hypothetical protein